MFAASSPAPFPWLASHPSLFTRDSWLVPFPSPVPLPFSPCWLFSYPSSSLSLLRTYPFLSFSQLYLFPFTTRSHCSPSPCCLGARRAIVEIRSDKPHHKSCFTCKGKAKAIGRTCLGTSSRSFQPMLRGPQKGSFSFYFLQKEAQMQLPQHDGAGACSAGTWSLIDVQCSKLPLRSRGKPSFYQSYNLVQWGHPWKQLPIPTPAFAK